MRTIVDIPEGDLAVLDTISRERRTSRAAVIREAVSRLVREREKDAWKTAFGAWSDMEEDGLAYQKRLRAEWPD